ncbi:hypothetical protein Esi_0101_0052 [Ectocarpus siliculosus]|uniref:Ion transport domain-containing protein n=1 Tax=Ectocarpus siliculosus TaxID=2880 RepID=D7FGS1_ECTSI|nr:hypothetical protein Esi_0101_0052 [Ectocarpus siliculosus]|eukprot:CBJ28347.1 hypothetical protein Esi_0101_0052 [Ectocarpus siliculosus]
MLLRHRDGTLPRDDYVQLMMCLRPDCDKDHTSALFSAAKKAEEQQSNSVAAVEDDRNLLSKTGFFMLCALGTADISRTQNERMKMYRRSRRRKSGRKWARARARLDGYQIVRAGDNPEGRPAWAYPLGAVLIFYFCLQAALRMIAGGVRPYFLEWRNILEMSLNMVGIAYYAQLWPRGQAFHSFYQILQALRLELLWINLHLLGPTSSDVATRLEFVFPAVIRASFVLFALTYTYAVVAYAMYCSTPLGGEPIGDLKDDSMVKRFAAVKEVANFATLPRSYASMMYVVMFSNWPMFMDAAGVVGNLVVAKVFFYSFKAIGFYFVMPVLLGFIVTSYMNAHVPTVEDPPKPPAAARKSLPPRQASSSRSPLIGSKGTPPNRGAGGGRGGAAGDEEKASPLVRFRKGLQRRSSFGDEPTRSKDRGKFGYSTLADGAHTEIDVAALAVPRGSQEALAELGQGEGDYDEVEDEDPSAEGRDREDQEDENSGGGDGDDEVEDDVATELWDAGKRRGRERAYSVDSSTEEEEEDHHAPVMVASRARSLSQTFWGVHQARDGGAANTTVMQGALARLENELANLRAENESLRADLGPREVSTRLHVAEMLKEVQTPMQDGASTSAGQKPYRQPSVGVGAANAAAGETESPLPSTSPEGDGSLRSRVVGSSNTIWGMQAILETEDGEETGQDLV